jgi:hypothetical protein
MFDEVNRSHSFATAMTRISVLPTDQRVDALLEFFIDVLNATDPERIRTMRDQVVERFSTCGGSFETCQLIIELINGHLALREAVAWRHATGAD